MTQPPLTFFLAHAGPDTARAKELRNLLHPDIRVFLDAYDLLPGDEWDRVLAQRQREARATVALVSSATEPAYYLREEIASAIAYQRQDAERHRLIPVYLDGVPKDPSRIPNGMRIQHALDAAVLGMSGVAAELKRTAALLAGVPPPSPSPDTPAPADRMAVFDALCAVLPSQFDEILFRVGAPRHQLVPSSEPLVRRAIDLIQWAELSDAIRMSGLRDAIHRAAPLALR